MEKVTQEELNEIIAKHKKWLTGVKKGLVYKKHKDSIEEAELMDEGHEFSELRARLYEKDLSNLDFFKSDLRNAVFIGCNFAGANLSNVDLGFANLGCSTFDKANMWETNLIYAILANTTFIDTNFSA